MVGFVSTVLWVAYGIVTPGRVAPLLTNLLGVVCEVLYMLAPTR
jgi:hypothetical protein